MRQIEVKSKKKKKAQKSQDNKMKINYILLD